MTSPTDDYEPSPWRPIAEHVDRYLATDGEDGAEWEGAQTIILATTGRKTGKVRRTPLIRVTDGDNYIVIASMGGAPKHPQWYLNLTSNPNVVLHDRGERHYLVARTASPAEKAALWPKAVEQWPAYDEYQANTDRDIPLVVLEPV